MYPQASAHPTKCADQLRILRILRMSLRILRMSYVFYVWITYILRMLIFHPQLNFEIFKIPAADLRMSADPADWITDGYGCLRMIRILADAYGFLSVSIRSYRKWPCDCSITVRTDNRVDLLVCKNQDVEIGLCDLFRVSFGIPLNPRSGCFSEGDSRASGTTFNYSDPPPPLPRSPQNGTPN